MQTEGRAPLTSSRAIRARRLFIVITTLTFGLDLLTKNWAITYLQFREPIRVIGDLLQLTYTTNSGAAFNLAENSTYILTALKLAVATFVIFYMSKVNSPSWAAALGALCGGVIGNLWDRATRSPGNWRGEVIDWIQLPHWPVFNIADSAIVLSAIGITVLAMRNIPPAAKGDSHDDSEANRG